MKFFVVSLGVLHKFKNDKNGQGSIELIRTRLEDGNKIPGQRKKLLPCKTSYIIIP